MFKKIIALTSLLLLLGCSIPELGFNVIPKQEYSLKISWLGHAGFMIESKNTRLYINPYSAPIGSLKGQGIIISHSNSDFCDLNSINTLSKDDSVIIAPPECIARLARSNTINLDIGKSYTIGEFLIQTLDAYYPNGTIVKGEGAGFVITFNNTRIYYAGVTDIIPEMSSLDSINVSILPIAGGELSMNLTEAAILMSQLRSSYNVPMLYGGNTGTSLDVGREFRTIALTYGVNVTLLSNQDLLIS